MPTFGCSFVLLCVQRRTHIYQPIILLVDPETFLISLRLFFGLLILLYTHPVLLALYAYCLSYLYSFYLSFSLPPYVFLVVHFTNHVGSFNQLAHLKTKPSTLVIFRLSPITTTYLYWFFLPHNPPYDIVLFWAYMVIPSPDKTPLTTPLTSLWDVLWQSEDAPLNLTSPKPANSCPLFSLAVDPSLVRGGRPMTSPTFSILGSCF